MSLLLTVYFFTKVCTFFCLYHLNEFSLNHFILNGSSCSLDTCRLKSKINTNYSANQTSPLVFTCTGSYPGNLIGLSVTVFQILVPLPMHTCVLWLGTSELRYLYSEPVSIRTYDCLSFFVYAGCFHS